MNERETIIEGLKAIAGGLQTHIAARVAKDLLGRLDQALAPIMASPPMLPYAIDLPAPWKAVPVTTTGERMFQHPDGRLACGIASENYQEVFLTPYAPPAHALVRGGGFIYIEADSEQALIARVQEFDTHYKAAIAHKSAPPTVRRIRRGG